MEIILQGRSDKQVGGLRLPTDIYDFLSDLAKKNNVSIQGVIRKVIEEAYYAGIVVKK
jgi:hypothetical protein